MAIPIALLLFRLRGAYFAIGSWVIAEVFLQVAQLAPSLMRVDTNISLPAGLVKAMAATRDGREFLMYWLFLALVIAVIAVIVGAVAHALRPRADRDPRQRDGGEVERHRRQPDRLVVFVVASSATAMTGALIFLQKLSITPIAAFSIGTWTVNVIFMTVIGGIGRVEGPLLGTVIFFVLRGSTRDFVRLDPTSPHRGEVTRSRTASRLPCALTGHLSSRFARYAPRLCAVADFELATPKAAIHSIPPRRKPCRRQEEHCIHEGTTWLASPSPATGLVFYELSHEWGHGAPALPGFDDVKLYRSTQHAKNGVMGHRIRMVMHSGTHLNAPIHLIQGAVGVGRHRHGAALRLRRAWSSVPKAKWEMVEPADLEAARPAIEPEDIVLIVTGWHRQLQRQHRVFRALPGPRRRRQPSGSSSAASASSPSTRRRSITRSPPRSAASQRSADEAPPATTTKRDDRTRRARRFPGLERRRISILLAAGIPTVENAGGHVDALVGTRCTFHAYPWYWHEGDACPSAWWRSSTPPAPIASSRAASG